MFDNYHRSLAMLNTQIRLCFLQTCSFYMQLFDFDKNGWVVKQTASMNKQIGLLFLYDT